MVKGRIQYENGSEEISSHRFGNKRRHMVRLHKALGELRVKDRVQGARRVHRRVRQSLQDPELTV